MKEQEINEASLTAKQGFANDAPVSQMDENGNAGGVMTYSDAAGGDLATHEADITLHKTAAEQSKLNNLADDANATYATKSAVDDCTPIVFQATYTDDVTTKQRTYSISLDQRVKAIEYFENGKMNPVLLVTTSFTDTTQYETYVMTVKRHVGVERMLVFYRINSPADIDSKCMCQLILRYSHSSDNSVTGWDLYASSIPFNDPNEYFADKYLPTASFDMNDFTESGGVFVITSDSVVGTNLPNGFTKISGHVFASLNKMGAFCTQIVTDGILKKTMIRSKVFDSVSGFVWTPWKQIDGDSESEVIRFTATYDVVDGVNKYTLASGENFKFRRYFEENKTNPIELLCNPVDPSKEIFKCSLSKVCIDGIERRMEFNSINRNNIDRLYIFGIRLSSGAWLGDVTLKCSRWIFEESEYKYARYSPYVSFDMNDWIDSGGIAAMVYDAYDDKPALVGINIPDGFTDFYGYVLKNDGYGSVRSYSCTQVVTDKILKKTMMRQAQPFDDRVIEWTPWKQIDAVVPEVYVVADYPTDLSNYPDGSIFIKEQI